MKKTKITGLIGLLFSTSLLAAETPINATDVIVTASRTSQQKENVIADVTVISQEEIERAGQSTFVELLQSQPGVEITSNGGAGSYSTVMLRGSNANQSIFLIDGVRVNSITAGTTYLGNIPLSQIERIEILRGPASALYGQDAIGGVIQIFTKKVEGLPRFNAEVGYGSYNSRTAQAGFGGSYNGLNYNLNVSSRNTDGFSALKINTDARADRDGYRNLSASGSLSYNINEKNQVGIKFLDSQGKIDYDSSVNYNNVNKSKQTSVSLFSKNQINDVWTSLLTVSKGVDKYDDISYSDWSSAWSHSYIESTQNQYSWQNNLKFDLGTFTLAYDRLEQDLNTSYNYQGKHRNSDGYFLGYLKDIGPHSIQANVRYEDNSQFGDHTTGSIGYGFQFNDQWRATTSYGTAFKAPTFNDVYAPPYWGADPNIKPEESENIEASLRYKNNASRASATLYDNRVTNLILSSGYPNYQMGNIGKAELKGLTLAASTVIDTWQLDGSLDIQSAENSLTHKVLPYRADRHGAIHLSKSFGDWNFGSEVIGSSERYNDVTNSQKMAGYAILNFVANYKINNDWTAQGRVNNLLDKDYVLALTSSSIPYNTPNANVFFSLRYSPSY
jgi:vitamin B12 transporter